MSFDIRNETRRVGIMKNGKLFLKKKNIEERRIILSGKYVIKLSVMRM